MDGSAQSVHSRAMLKVPRSNSRRRRVSIPAVRRSFKTWKRWLRSGWNGWRISAHPKCSLCSSAVRVDRPDGAGSVHPASGGDATPHDEAQASSEQREECSGSTMGTEIPGIQLHGSQATEEALGAESGGTVQGASSGTHKPDAGHKPRPNGP